MDLSIIILNYNGKDWLEKLLPTLQSYWLGRTKFKAEVVVVDNASTDDSVAYLEHQTNIRLIRSDRNGGFAYGNNLALKDLTSRYAMLLNSDTELLPKGSDMDKLIDFMDASPNVGVVTPSLRLDSGLTDLACHRGEPTPWAAFSYFSGLERIFPRSRRFGQYHQTHHPMHVIHDIDACSGAAMLVRTEALAKVGLLDERFFMYAEDIDWCRRFREAGYRVVYHPEVTLIHHKYQSGLENGDKALRNETRKWFYETMLQYYDKHYAKRYPGICRWALKVFLAMKRQPGKH